MTENKNSRDYKDLIFALQFLYPLKNEPEYSAIPELLPFVGIDGLFNLCKYFGGHQIKIPTLEDLNSLLLGMELYTKVQMKGISEDKAIEKLLRDVGEIPADVYETYKQITKLYNEIEENG